MNFEDKYSEFWQQFGRGRKMVLSTSLNDAVTSRMMSVVALDGKLYFQTDKSFRKYEQLKGNPHAALCIDNIQLEGWCEEIGSPGDYLPFFNAYRNCFPSSFQRYSSLENERLFVFTPFFVERWVYIDNVPFMETFDVSNQKYVLGQYQGR